jgi:hypothetical protein
MSIIFLFKESTLNPPKLLDKSETLKQYRMTSITEFGIKQDGV